MPNLHNGHYVGFPTGSSGYFKVFFLRYFKSLTGIKNISYFQEELQPNQLICPSQVLWIKLVVHLLEARYAKCSEEQGHNEKVAWTNANLVPQPVEK